MDNGFLQKAQEAARMAGAHIVANLGKLRSDEIDSKQAADFVTRVDRESEDMIVRLIKDSFPGHSFLAEESHHERDSGGYRWIIDPLDGTTNFIHQYPVFAVSIALQHESEIIVGVVFDPLRNEMFSAVKGGGAQLNGKPISVSGRSDRQSALVATGFPFRRKELLDDYLRLFRAVLIKVSDIRRAGSAALDLVHVASGRCDAFFELGLSPWDIAAGSLIIKEAGGLVTDFKGGEDYLESGNIVAGTPEIHRVLLTEVKEVFRN
jgi:myo-inositol-1(or 4)-monophosphatase